jgi:hypothetical protein
MTRRAPKDPTLIRFKDPQVLTAWTNVRDHLALYQSLVVWTGIVTRIRHDFDGILSRYFLNGVHHRRHLAHVVGVRGNDTGGNESALGVHRNLSVVANDIVAMTVIHCFGILLRSTRKSPTPLTRGTGKLCTIHHQRARTHQTLTTTLLANLAQKLRKNIVKPFPEPRKRRVVGASSSGKKSEPNIETTSILELTRTRTPLHETIHPNRKHAGWVM